MLMTCVTIGRGEHGTTHKSPNASLTIRCVSQEFSKRASETTAVTPPSAKKKIEKTINFWSSFAYARLLGEDRHHGIKFSLNSRLKH